MKKTASKSGNDKFRHEELAKIHIGKKWAMDNLLGFNQESYEGIILEVSNKRHTSSGDLNWQGRRAVLERMKELGFVAKPTKAPVRKLADDPQSKMLRGRWIELHRAGIVRNPSETALCAMVKRITGKDALQWLNDKDVTAVNEALKKMAEQA